MRNGIDALSPSSVILVSLAAGFREYEQSLGDILVSQQLVICEFDSVAPDEIKRIINDQDIPKSVRSDERPHASPWLINRFQSAEPYWNNIAKIWFGSVFSANTVIGNSKFRNRLQELSGRAIGAEIGGAGLYAACQDRKIDWILVDAIADWGDGRKIERDLENAARNAASFVLHTIQLAPLKRNDYQENLVRQPYWHKNRRNMTDMDFRADIGIIIALEEEFQELFPQIEAKPVFNKAIKQYYYLFEKHGALKGLTPYRCVTTFMGGMGPTQAAIISDRLLDQFHAITIVNIGIAGSMSKDIFVGDVIVADQVDEYLASSKAIDASADNDWGLQLSGDPFKSDPGYVKHAQNLKYAFPESNKNWISACQSRLNNSIDQSIRKSLLHEELIREYPRIQFGHIASGPIVGSSDRFVNWLKKHRDRKYLALEMESAGVLNAAHTRGVSTIVIRGVSDYCDQRKEQLDEIGSGGLRRYAMNNAIELLWTLMDLQLIKSDKDWDYRSEQ